MLIKKKKRVCPSHQLQSEFINAVNAIKEEKRCLPRPDSIPMIPILKNISRMIAPGYFQTKRNMTKAV